MSQLTASAPARSRSTVRLPSSRVAARPQATRLRVVTGAPVRSSATGFGIICSVVLAIGLVAVLLLNMARAEQSFALSALQQSSTRLADDEEQLRSDISSVSAPQQVALAAQEMGLRPAGSVTYVRAADGAVLGVAQNPAALSPFTVGTLPDTPANRVAQKAVQASSLGVTIHTPPAPKPAPSATEAPAKAGAAGASTTKKTPAAKAGAGTAPSAEPSTTKPTTEEPTTSTR